MSETILGSPCPGPALNGLCLFLMDMPVNFVPAADGCPVLSVLLQGAAAVGTVGTPAAVPVVALVTLLSLAFALSAWSRAGLYCNHQDLSPKYAGAH